MPDEVPARTADVFRALKDAAREMRTVTYRELEESVGLPRWTYGPTLAHIRDEVCRARDLPWLTAIVVKKDTRLPGDGFLKDTGVKFDLESDFKVWWQAMAARVYAWDWSHVELPDDSSRGS